ncbi:MAG: dihydropyrimidinase [Pseudomonadota bacterium]
MTHDLVIHGGTLVTASGTFTADIGIKDGRIATLGSDLDGKDRIDATGKLVMPGGIESHCHIAQESSTGMMTADDYRTGSVSAAFGGNTTIIPFAAQLKGQPIQDVIQVYDERASVSVLDFSYHLIVTDTSVDGFQDQMQAAFDRGVTSFKVFLTYDIALTDEQFLDVLDAARRAGALTMVHAENNALINWMRRRMGDGGYVDPKYHAPSRPVASEVEAIHRAVQLSSFVDAPLLIVHVSTPEGMAEIAKARLAGAPIYAETCPQYLFLKAEDLDRPDGTKFICSPPLRDKATQDALWRGLQTGVFDLYSSDHAPYRNDETGKLSKGGSDFRAVANGMPGIELRAPLLFSEGVVKGRITLPQFVQYTSANAARLFGLSGRKGTLAIGADADLAIWDPTAEWTVSHDQMHDNMDYSPFEGRQMTGGPETIIQRGNILVQNGELHATPGDGQFLRREKFDRTNAAGIKPAEMDPARNFGAEIT